MQNAATYDVGLIAAGTPESFAFVVSKGGFTDYFTFTLPANSGSGYSVMNLQIPGLYDLKITGFALFSNADGIVGSGDDKKLAFATSGDKTAFNTGSTAAGNYFLKIKGTTLGDVDGGIYNGSISVTAVPEPESYAMLLAGLGLMGTIARRRNKSSAV